MPTRPAPAQPRARARRVALAATLALAATAAARPAHAQAAPAPAADPQPVLTGPRWSPTVGLHFGIPSVLSAHVGVARLRERARGGEIGPYVGVEPGLAAVKAGIGVMTRGDIGALTVQAAALRTTDRLAPPYVAARNATYVGLDARAMALLVTFGAGLYVRTDGGDARRILPTVTIGVSY